MPRQARLVIPGVAHYITQHGNNRQDIFFADEDREVYLDILREQCEKFSLQIDGYCLMPNHIHLVAVPKTADSLSKAIGRTNLYYTRYVNKLHGRSGHLWQDRFFSAPLGGKYYWKALVYVERNPVRAKLVRRAWRWVWSSALGHVSGKDPSGLLNLSAWKKKFPRGFDWPDWKETLIKKQDKEVEESFRGRGNRRGYPLGSDKFIAKLETKLGKRLRPNPIGRPKKK